MGKVGLLDAKRALLGTRVEGPARWLWSRRSRIARIDNRYDRQAAQVMARVLHRRASCLDVGSHIGSFIRAAIALAPDGVHHAFEPLPEFARHLRDALPACVRVHQLALGAATVESDFVFVETNPGYSGLRERDYDRPDERRRTIRVAQRRLDDVVGDGARVDLVKVDVEGGELAVFRGGRRMLERCRPHVVFEFGLGAADHYGARPETLHALFDACGLSVSTMGAWLRGAEPLSRDAFVEQFDRRLNYYFLAHPRG